MMMKMRIRCGELVLSHDCFSQDTTKARSRRQARQEDNEFASDFKFEAICEPTLHADTDMHLQLRARMPTGMTSLNDKIAARRHKFTKTSVRVNLLILRKKCILHFFHPT